MELRKKEEVRDITTTQMILRQTGNVVIYNRGPYRKSARRSGSNRSIYKRAVARQKVSKSGVKTLPRNLLNAQQKKKWDSYSTVEQKKVLVKVEKAVKKKSQYDDKTGKSAEKLDEYFDYIWYHQALKSKKKRSGINTRKVQEEKVSQETGFVFPESVRKKEHQEHTKEKQYVRYKEKHIQKEQRKQDRLYAAHLIGTIESDLRKDTWIKERQIQGYMENDHGEIERHTGVSAIRTAILPVRVQIILLRTKVSSALMHTGTAILKYVAATVIPLLTVVIFFLFVASLLSGIAGEEEQLGYASSGYEIVAYAEEWIGITKYIWGAGRDSATSWQHYADCSSFVHGVFAHFGYEIGFDTYAQEHAGTLVSGGLTEALPGDIILFFSGSIGPGMSSHVGIYAGEGRMIHCSGGRSNVSPETAGRGVCWGSPTADGRPFQVRRIVEWTVGNAGNATSGHRKDTRPYTQGQIELIWAIVAQEDNGSYAGALAVISSAMNRTESASWRYCG